MFWRDSGEPGRKGSVALHALGLVVTKIRKPSATSRFQEESPKELHPHAHGVVLEVNVRIEFASKQ